MKTFYNEFGKPIAYSDNDIIVFSFPGEPLAYIFDDKIYSFDGKQLGWFLDGWIRDLDGYCVFFTETATGGPLKPLKQLKPLKSLKKLVPFRQYREYPHLKPIKRCAWSRYKDLDFFKKRIYVAPL